MKSKNELERVATYLSDFLKTLPASTQPAVMNDIQTCLNKIAIELEQQYVKQEPEPEPTPEV